MAAPDQRRFDPVGEFSDLLKRHRPPARHVDHEAAQGLQLGALLGNGAGDDVDQIDIIAHLGDGRAGQNGIDGLTQCLRTDAQRPSPVLIHLNADDLGRLVPVEIDISRIGRLAEQ